MLLVAEAGGDIERAGIARGTAAAELHIPKRGVREDSAVAIFHLANRVSRNEVEDVDRSVSEVTHQQIPGKSSEASRSNRRAPRGIQASLGSNATNQITVRIEEIDIA